MACIASAANAASSADSDDGRPVFAGLAVRGAVRSDEAAALTAELGRLFGERGARVVAPLAPQASIKLQARALKDVDKRLDEAQALLKKKQPERALVAARDALAMFEEELAFIEDDAAWARYRELLELTAAILLQQGDKLAADAVLLQLLAVEPGYQPARRRTPAEVARRVSNVMDEAAATPPAPLEIKTRPAGARLVVDGRPVGEAPAVLEVAPGVHYVQAAREGRVQRARVVVGEDGARLQLRTGGPEQEAASALVAALARPASKSRDLVTGCGELADVCLVAVAVPWGERAQVFVARVAADRVEVVLGAIVPKKEGRREAILFELVEQALTRKKGDAWLGDGAGGDPATLRQALLTGQGAATVEEPWDVPVPLLVLSGLGGAAVIGGGVIAAVLVAQREGEKDAGFRFRVDTNALR